MCRRTVKQIASPSEKERDSVARPFQEFSQTPARIWKVELQSLPRWIFTWQKQTLSLFHFLLFLLFPILSFLSLYIFIFLFSNELILENISKFD